MPGNQGKKGRKFGRHARNPSSKLQLSRTVRNATRRAAIAAQQRSQDALKNMKVPRGTARAKRRERLRKAYAETKTNTVK